MTWMQQGTDSMPAKIVAAIAAAFLLGSAGLNHAIVLSLDRFAALHSGAPFDYLDWIRLMLWAALGNMLGGIGLISMLRLAQLRRTNGRTNQPDPRRTPEGRFGGMVVRSLPATETGPMPRREQAQQRLLVTVLFTDIVASTERAAAVGDKRWRQLVGAHHALIRRELKRHHGREIDTAGDGFFATFDQPADAIRCAEAIVNGVKRLGIEVRAGIHMGEVEVIGPKVGGIAVHIGARVMAKAGPGQVVVSSTVRDLMSGSDLRFEDLGVQELKGVPAQWRLYAIEPSGPPSPEDVRADAAEEEEARSRRSPKRLGVLATALVVLAAASVALILGHRSGGGGFVVAANTVARIDPTSGKVAGGATVGTTPTTIAYGDGTLWVGNFDDRTLQLVDVSSGNAGSAFGGLTGNPTALAVGYGYVWVTVFQGGALRIDPRQHNAASPVDVGTGAQGISVGLGSVWITNSQDDTLLRIDPASNPPRVAQAIPLDAGSSPVGVAVGAGSVWVAENLKGAVVRVDPVTGQIQQTIHLLRGNPEQLAFGDGYLWASNPSDDSVMRVDPRTNSGFTITSVGNGPRGIAAGPAGVWVANSLDGTAAEIEGTRVVRRVELGSAFSVDAVAETPGAVWVTVHSPS